MKLKNNQHYLNISINNPEKMDERYMFLKWDKNITKYVETTKKLKELLATIKTLNKKEVNADEFYKDLYNLIINNKYSRKSELNCFINACDSTITTLKESDITSFKYFIDLYLKYRDFTEITPKEWIQAIIDKGASRSKGSIGEKKLIKILKDFGFIVTTEWNDFHKYKKAVSIFSKKEFNNQKIEKELGIKLQFNSQNKMLDLIFKNDNKIAFIEAKHLKEGGGSQDKQIKELIEIIKNNSRSKNVFYGAFLDGNYSNYLLTNIQNPIGNNKLKNQQSDIIHALKNNDNSFWFNTAGFIEFVKDFS